MFRNFLTLVLLFTCYNHISAQDLYTAAQEWPVKINDGWFTARTISFGQYTTSSRKNGIADREIVSFIKDPINPFNCRVSGKEENILIQVIQAANVAFSGHSLPSFLDNMPATAIFTYILINGTKIEPLKRWEMILKDVNYLELNENKPAGILRSADDELRITAHNRFGVTNSYENICYEFHIRRQVVAAVVTGAHPRVWMSAEMDGKPLQPVLVAAIGALLVR
ncbi:hypothetical protein [Chitinophaga filiformis]|uniref:Uncharacterized protein n=1 Tax=Chitinophaga filiformis TaxID=104663 RepID=A0A1G7JBG0_CHIFI|nr:hypothetical protein [Chitinophaga filiformis]SDF22245.1 hypothetical protein SAMN04488121_1011173 [Chitinophaga filiformis]